MKTKELVRKLIKADPDGEAEVCVGNIDIIDVDGPMSSYWDGRFIKIGLDEKNIMQNNCHGVSSVTVKTNGLKIKLQLKDAEDAFIDNPEAEFILEEEELFTEESRALWYRKVEEWRESGRKFYQEFDELVENLEKEKQKQGNE